MAGTSYWNQTFQVTVTLPVVCVARFFRRWLFHPGSYQKTAIDYSKAAVRLTCVRAPHNNIHEEDFIIALCNRKPELFYTSTFNAPPSFCGVTFHLGWNKIKKNTIITPRRFKKCVHLICVKINACEITPRTGTLSDDACCL